MNPINQMESQVVIPVSAVTQGATATGNLDTYNYNAVSFQVLVGTELNTNAVAPSFTVKESDVTNATTFGTFHTSLNAVSVSNTAAHTVLVPLNAKVERKRYLRVELTPGTATNDAVTAAVVANCFRVSQGPNSTSDLLQVASSSPASQRTVILIT